VQWTCKNALDGSGSEGGSLSWPCEGVLDSTLLTAEEKHPWNGPARECFVFLFV